MQPQRLFILPTYFNEVFLLAIKDIKVNFKNKLNLEPNQVITKYLNQDDKYLLIITNHTHNNNNFVTIKGFAPLLNKIFYFTFVSSS